MDEDFKTTTSHVVIRAWAERWGGKPAVIAEHGQADKPLGIRLDFPGKTDEALLSQAHHNKDVNWDKFFAVFEEQHLAFEYLPEPEEMALPDAYRFLKREALKEEEGETPFDPTEFDRAIRGVEPPFFTHGGKADNPHEGEIEPVETLSMESEEGPGGSVPDLESDDDTTQVAQDAGLLEKGDPQEKHDHEE